MAELGSLAVGGDRVAWYRNALTEPPQEYPAVNALLFFHAKDDHTVMHPKLDWSIESDAVLDHTIASAIRQWTPETPQRPR